MITGIIIAAVIAVIIAYILGVSHGLTAYEMTHPRGSEWFEPGAAYDYQEPYRGEITKHEVPIIRKREGAA